MEPIILAAGVLFIIVVLILLIIVSVRNMRENESQREQTIHSLGFRTVDPVPVDVSERVVSLSERGFHKKMEVRNLYQQHRPDCDLYLFDLWDVSGDDNEMEASQAVALISPDLDLPRFTVFPKVDAVGWAADLANQFIGKLMGQHAAVIDFSDRSTFDKRYFVTGDDELSVRHYLTSAVLAALTQTQLEGLVVEAWGDVILVTEMNTGKSRKEDLEVLIRGRRDLALALHDRLLSGL